MTSWTLVHTAQICVSLVTVGLAMYAAREAWEDRRLMGDLSVDQREVLDERWHSAQMMLALTIFMLNANAIQLAGIDRPINWWGWVGNGFAFRGLFLVWLIRRIHSRRRLRALVRLRRSVATEVPK